MPIFELVSQREANTKTATGKRAQVLDEYTGFIAQLKPGRAGALRASEGETLGAVRRRLGAAAKLQGKRLVIKRTGDVIYFWSKTATGRGPGRPRKVA